MVAKFLDLNNWEFKQRRRRRQREQLKRNKFRLAKQQLCTCITLFVHFLAVVARLRHETSQFHALASIIHGVGKHNTKFSFSFSFSKLKYGPFGFNPRKFRQPEMLLPWRRDVKDFTNSWIPKSKFLSNCENRFMHISAQTIFFFGFVVGNFQLCR